MTQHHQDNHPVVALSPAEQDCLRIIVGCMIPASDKHGVPGADDPSIFVDLLASIRRDGEALRTLLAAVDKSAGGSLAGAPPARQAMLLAQLRQEQPGFFSVVEALASRAYYRNDTVLTSIGMEPRSPFPKGYDLPQGDLSLLDVVRDRGKVWRDADDAPGP